MWISRGMFAAEYGKIMGALALQDTYRIELPIFEGPFDLLLFFIERDELDVNDIPISRITRDFLDYMHHMETLNMEVASEFILVAGTLMRIKSRMLIPRPVINEAGEVEDPRRELVDRLLEYKRFKSVQDTLAKMEEDASMVFKREFAKQEEKLFLDADSPEEELSSIDLYTILRTFKRVWARHEEREARPKHVIRAYPYSVDQVKARVTEILAERGKIDFVSFIMEHPDKIYCVFTFLSVLEMAQMGLLSLVVGEGYNNFWLCQAEVQEAA
jgi:segregation and condensation protein A